MNPENLEPHLLSPDAGFSDPRLAPDFCSAWWPMCNGTDLPALSLDAHDQRCLELITAYYELNRQLALPEGSPSRSAGVVQARQSIDQLEDRYAPLGFFGEPQFVDGLCRNVSIVRPGLPGLLSAASSLSSQFAIPGLEELPAEELTGPPAFRRWSHG
jgi:hypothetical protein